MADIRQTGLLDDFVRAGDENPALPPWVRDSPIWVDCQIVQSPAPHLKGTQFPPGGSLMYYRDLLIHAGDPPVIETWGRAEGSAALSDAWRFGMLEAGLAPNGYQMVMGIGVGGAFWDLRRYDAGSPTSIGASSASLPGSGIYCLMRLARGLVEVWRSNTSDPNGAWTQIVAVADTTYRGGFFIHYGATGVETGWEAVGGGAVIKSQIYRYVSN